ncbi:hypothetical protein B2G71_01020 [Novosphingobium sp. PC22D]|uniref:energy transducer TonB n=1 Tax=Novosphingobium sp. PC22D TaxID=1962403 RepID=UPI000BFB0375|nr:energy transducer TonB [Novosphingobium sp. PC22D]PEQ14221.1 hypothetical protein B2G71_01020 [Novosphingobium sp. PC22D]
MSYANSGAGSRRVGVIATVAAIHGLALYGLVTGLAASYIEVVVPGLTGRNIPIEPPPPPPEPQVTPKQEASTDSRLVAPKTPQLVESRGPVVFDAPLELPLPGPIPDKGPLIELPQPTVSASPKFSPKAARPRNDTAGWISTNDYPSSALRRGEQGTVRFELTIGANGKVEGCRVTAPSGSPALDAATCKYVAARARFEPARDETGAKVAGTYASNVTWVIPED